MSKATPVANPKPLVIHHLTDLHIGPLHYQADIKLPFVKDRVKGWSRVEKYLQHLKNNVPDIVVISGDFTSYADEDEYQKVQEVFEKIIGALEDRHGSKIPRLCIVPGNHDVDWSIIRKNNDVDRSVTDNRLRRFSNLVRMFREKIIAPHGAAASFHYYKDYNVLIYTFDSCPLGGIEHPALMAALNTISELASCFRTLIDQKHNDENKFAEAVQQLKKLRAQDPGYIDPEELNKLEENLPDNHDQLLKIAVVHHNPTNLPSEDIEQFDAIINGGPFKSKLMELGFDLILHGHRHQPHCSYEEYVQDLSVGPAVVNRVPYKQGIYSVSGGTLGCLSEGPWFQIQIDDAHSVSQDTPPSSLVSAFIAKAQGAEPYKIPASPSYRFTIGKMVYPTLRFIQERSRRVIKQNDKDDVIRVRTALNAMLPAMFEMQAAVDDWEEEVDWPSNFNDQLKRYARIVAVSVVQPSSWLNPRALTYVIQQFAQRLFRRKLTNQLWLSPEVAEALARHGRKFSPPFGLADEFEIKERDSMDDGELEITRVFLWNTDTASGPVVSMLDKLHRLFAVPAFVLDPTPFATDNIASEEFVLGLDTKGELVQGFRYNPFENQKTLYIRPKDGQVFVDRCNKFLADPKLYTLQDVAYRSQGSLLPADRTKLSADRLRIKTARKKISTTTHKTKKTNSRK